jgi:hypothetical protein
MLCFSYVIASDYGFVGLLIFHWFGVAVTNVFARREACCLVVSNPHQQKHYANLR